MQRDMRRLILSLVPVTTAIVAVAAPQALWERTGVAESLRQLRDALGLGDLFEAISAQTAVVTICAVALFLINLAPMFGRGTPPQSR